jgi:hypothetical protein
MNEGKLYVINMRKSCKKYIKNFNELKFYFHLIFLSNFFFLLGT